MLPPSFADVYTAAEWSVLVRQIDETYVDNIMPFCPIICTMLCIPCLPSCLIGCYGYKHTQAIEVIFAHENTRLSQQGLYWSRTPGRAWVAGGGPFMCLSWRPVVRTRWEAANPRRRRISHEPLPVEFQSEETKKAAAAAARAQLQLQRQPQTQAGRVVANQQRGREVQMVDVYAPGSVAVSVAAMAPDPGFHPVAPVQGYVQRQRAEGQPSPHSAMTMQEVQQPPYSPTYSPLPSAYPPGGVQMVPPVVYGSLAPQHQSMDGPAASAPAYSESAEGQPQRPAPIHPSTLPSEGSPSDHRRSNTPTPEVRFHMDEAEVDADSR